MSENSTFSPVLTGRERTAVPAKSLSFVEGVSMIVGTNIGAGVLSIAYASSKAGFTTAVLAGAGGQPDHGDYALCRGIHGLRTRSIRLSDYRSATSAALAR